MAGWGKRQRLSNHDGQLWPPGANWCQATPSTLLVTPGPPEQGPGSEQVNCAHPMPPTWDNRHLPSLWHPTPPCGTRRLPLPGAGYTRADRRKAHVRQLDERALELLEQQQGAGPELPPAGASDTEGGWLGLLPLLLLLRRPCCSATPTWAVVGLLLSHFLALPPAPC